MITKHMQIILNQQNALMMKDMTLLQTKKEIFMSQQKEIGLKVTVIKMSLQKIGKEETKTQKNLREDLGKITGYFIVNN